MHFNKFGLIICLMIIAAACSKDDDNCDAPALSENIVGEWDFEIAGNMGEVEFQEDGTLIDPDDVLIGGEINGQTADEKTYSVSGDTSLVLKASAGAQSISADLDVTSNECDEIKISAFGFEGTFDRK